MEVKVDIDEEKVLVNGQWYTEEELKETIKEKVENGDFDIADYASALKVLQTELQGVETFTIKLKSDIAEKINSMAEERGETPGTIIREILAKYFSGETGTEEPSPSPEEEETPEEEGEFEYAEEDEEVTSEVAETQGEETSEEEGEEKAPKEEKKILKVQCPRCGTTIVVEDTGKRPLTVVCPNCGSRGKIK